MKLMNVYIILVSIALAMDCFAISICMSSMSGAKLRDYIRIPFHFSLFHLIMIVMGFFLGSVFRKIVQGVDHWVAFVLLSAIGLKIMLDSVKNEKKIRKPASEGRLLLLSLATSVDALVIGITFAFTLIDLWSSALVLVITIALLTIIGLFLGSKLHKLNLKYIGILGGLVLVAISFKTLFTHILG